MQQLIQDIKNQTFKSVYLLYGEEAYLRLQYRDKLKQAMVAEDDTMNYSYYEGKGINPAEIIDLAETMPFFADRRVIFLENTGFFKDSDDKLPSYMASIPESTCMVFIESDVDKRLKLFKAIDKSGRCVEFKEQSEDTLKKWIATRVKNEGKQISMHTLDVFLERVGTSMINISMEMEKLFSYTLHKDVITEQDVIDVCTVVVSNRVYDMIGFIAEKRCSEALEIYHELIGLKESPFGIMALLIRQFNTMLQIKELQEYRNSLDMIATKVKMSSYIVKKYLPRVKCFTQAEMREVLKDICEADENIKKGVIDPEIAVELIIVKTASKPDEI